MKRLPIVVVVALISSMYQDKNATIKIIAKRIAPVLPRYLSTFSMAFFLPRADIDIMAIPTAQRIRFPIIIERIAVPVPCSFANSPPIRMAGIV